ncbi:MAG: RelA/SpoT family protein [Candidatus Kapaibacteriales bacterium]
MLLYPKEKKTKILINPKFGLGEKEDLETLHQLCKARKPDFDPFKIEKAYYWNFRSNQNKLRRSGEPFYTHALEVAKIIINHIVYDDIMVIVALLHNILDRPNGYKIDDVREEFGETTAKILEGVNTITELEKKSFEDPEYLRRIILSLFTDIRILLVKIADRFHDMQTIEFLEPERQIQLAESTMAIYVPFAHRFGLGVIKGELEDLAFRVLEPEKYQLVVRELKTNRQQYENLLFVFAQSIIDKLKNSDHLIDNDVSFEVHGRVKHIYSTYKKSLLRNKPVRELYDIIAIRIILDTDDVSYCYKVHQEILSLGYKLVHETYKDYIKNPKVNGYQSLHSAFYGPGGNMFEVQIRTRKMHETAERGFAAHYHYKNDFVPFDSILTHPEVDNWISSIRGKMDRIGELSLEQLLEGFPSEVVLNNIYVFTPMNEIKILPPNSTALDFAYHIHTDVGNHCIGVKVNGRTQPFNFILKSGDKVEVITSLKAEPKREWLSFVRTSKAINGIEAYFKNKEKELINLGRNLLLSNLKRFNIGLSFDKFATNLRMIFPNDKIAQLFQLLATNNEFRSLLEDFLMDISKSSNWDLQNFNKYLEQSGPFRKLYDFYHNQKFAKESYTTSIRDCCYPVPYEIAVGVIKENHIFVHRMDCPNVSYKANKLNTFIVDWRFVPFEKYNIAFQFTAQTTDKIIEGLKFLQGLDSNKSSDYGLSISIEKIKVIQRESSEDSRPCIISILFLVHKLEISNFLNKISKIQQNDIKIERIQSFKNYTSSNSREKFISN